MPTEPRLTAPIAAALSPGVECLTATRRQAHELLRVQAELEQAAGRTVWQTARVLPWDAGLKAAWMQTAGQGAALIDEAAAQRLWRAIIADSAAGEALIDPRAAARAARRSYVLAAEWGIALQAIEPATPEQAAFVGWARSYDEFLRDRGYLDRALLPAILRGLPVPADARPVCLHALEPLPASHAALVAHWRAAGRAVHVSGRPQGAATPVAMRFRTVEEELEGCVAWAHERLRANPTARLAVLWPELDDRAPALRRLLDDRLYPLALLAAAPPERPYALGSAPPLARYGCVQAALGLLSLALPVVRAAQLGALLRSPYVAAADEEAAARALLDARLRRDSVLELRASELERLLAAPGAGVPALLQALRAVAAQLGGTRQRPLDEWAVAFGQALAASGWPGTRRLASDEYQTVEKFQAALGELAALSRVLGTQSLAAALGELAEVAAGIDFQPEAGSPAVVFLDGPAPVGYPLDGLWVAGLEASRFPAVRLPDPFLPLAEQRRAGVPGAEVGAGRDEAARLVADWRAWAGELVLSVAAYDGTTEQRASPLLRDLPPAEPQPRLSTYAELVRAAARREPVPPSVLPALAPGAPIAGGSAVLEYQSACPFRAALRWRLHVRELEQAASGVAPTLRGLLAHAALAWLWGELQSSAALAALDAGAQRTLIAAAIDAAFAAHARDAPRGRLGRLEREWLAATLARLLDVERTRAPFTVVATEQRHEFGFDGHTLSVTLDRLDRLDDGRSVLIDYKTGRNAKRRWVAERLEDVQLPLYASQLAEPPAAIAHAQLPLVAKPYAGLAADRGLLPGVGPARGADADPSLAFAALLERWAAQTRSLAAEFIRGRADVDPAPGACDYCRHALVCRIVLDPGDVEAAAMEADDDE